ncbi:hypothetical protein ACSS6W_005031 [Trichoderma asperelloides]
MGTTQKKKKKPKKASVKRKEKRTTTTLSCRTMEMINNAVAAMPSPPSTAPPAVTSSRRLQTATRSGLQRIERLSDSLIPGQPRPRAYPRAVQNYLPTSGLLPTSSPLPETPADQFAVNELDFEDHFDLLYSKHCNKQAPRRKKENTKNFT